MKNVLIINGHQKYDVMAEGKLTQTYIQSANNFFKENDFKVKHSTIESDYNINDELEKFKWADYILFQYPIYWMSLPWLTKKYIDEIFNAGYQKVTHQSDGRSRSDISKKYGSGG
ncbi:MAG: NAD(P)H-dependent oxidoreductase, partial [Campylobacteraceae bacterium]|nr:NAD(P)H-dependent oxidoreductase [Campylobacteraceae bacterium]